MRKPLPPQAAGPDTAPEPDLHEIRRLLAAGRYDEAVTNLTARLERRAAADSAGRGPLLVLRSVAQRRQGDFRAATQDCEAAIDCLRRPGLEAALGEALAEHGVLLKEQALLQQARERYLQAIALLDQAGSSALAGRVQSDLGALHLEEGRFDEALGSIHRALETQLATGHARYSAISRFDLACVHLEQGRPRLALEALAAARPLFTALGERASEGLVAASQGAALAMLDQAKPALARFDEAATLLHAAQQPICALAAEVHRGHLDLAIARAATDEGDRARAIAAAQVRVQRAHSEELRPGLPFMRVSDDVRFAVRVLSRALAAVDAPSAVLRVGPQHRWFEPPHGARADLRTRVPLQRLFAALVTRRLEAPGAPLSLEELQRAGWPGVTLRTGSGANRVHVALATLRTLGLRPILRRNDTGYLLDPDVAVDIAR